MSGSAVYFINIVFPEFQLDVGSKITDSDREEIHISDPALTPSEFVNQALEIRRSCQKSFFLAIFQASASPHDEHHREEYLKEEDAKCCKNCKRADSFC